MARDDGADWLHELADPARREGASRRLHRYLRGVLAKGFGRQLSDAQLDDLAQDATVRIVERRGDFRGESCFTTWAASVAVHRALEELRRAKHQRRSLEELAEVGRATLTAVRPEGLARLQERQAGELLERAIDEALTERQREALLAELGGMEMMEIARRMGRSRGALYKLLHDARKRLRRHFEERGVGLDDLLPPQGAP